MKQLETYVLTAKEGADRGLHPLTNDQANFVACANAGGKLVLYQWFANQMSAIDWTLEKSVWEFTEN